MLERLKISIGRILKPWKDEVKRCLLLVIGILMLLCNKKLIYAEIMELPEDVVVVKNEREMIRRMISGMEKHQSNFAFSYPGIKEDFKEYNGQFFLFDRVIMERLSKKNGYLAGILENCCITISGNPCRYVSFHFMYLTTKKQEKKIDKRVKQIVKKIGSGNRVHRIKAAHDYLVKHMQYDSRYVNPCYAFTKGRGVCMSYALAYQRILQEMGIPCIYVEGKNHAWNMVKISGKWYNVDVTWDDAVGGYQYFLKSDAEFPRHKRPANRWFSSLKMAKKSYPLYKIK